MTRRRKSPPPLNGSLGLLIAILSDTPRLPGAACRDHPDLFDATHATGQGAMTLQLAQTRDAAIRICRTCPALDPCRAWLDNVIPPYRPGGVVAGRIVTTRGTEIL
jgi:WhiB family redox-sensing transcriptional regulator